MCGTPCLEGSGTRARPKLRQAQASHKKSPLPHISQVPKDCPRRSISSQRPPKALLDHRSRKWSSRPTGCIALPSDVQPCRQRMVATLAEERLNSLPTLQSCQRQSPSFQDLPLRRRGLLIHPGSGATPNWIIRSFMRKHNLPGIKARRTNEGIPHASSPAFAQEMLKPALIRLPSESIPKQILHSGCSGTRSKSRAPCC